MARFNFEQSSNYGGNGGTEFFSLKNDRDVAKIRFMYETLEDIEGLAVHRMEVDGKERYINCLRAYNEPVENCPLCQARQKVQAKLFLHVYDQDTETVKIWDRGKTFFSRIASLCARYNPLVSTVFEVERVGKAGDTSTTYEFYNQGTDDIGLEDLPEIEPILGGLVLDKSYEELEFFLDNGYFEDDEEQAPPSRTQSRRNPSTDKRSRQEQTPQRRETKASERPTRRIRETSEEQAPPSRRRKTEDTDAF